MLSALRARWVSTCPTVHPGSRLGAAPSSVPASRQLVEHRQQPLVRGRRAGDVPVELASVHRRHGTRRARLSGMQLGMIGLGRMGANMVRRLERAGHECVGYDVDAAAVARPRRRRGRRRADARRPGRQARPAPPRLDHGARPRSSTRRSPGSSRCSSAATRSSTAATRGTATTSTAPPRWPPSTASTTSTSARAAAPTGSSGATA